MVGHGGAGGGIERRPHLRTADADKARLQILEVDRIERVLQHRVQQAARLGQAAGALLHADLQLAVDFFQRLVPLLDLREHVVEVVD